MTALFLVSMPVALAELRRLAALRGFAHDEGRALHHFLSEAFGKSALKPFRLMPAPKARTATLYAYSAISETGLRDNLDLAAPELLGLFDTAHLAVRDMPPSWREGRRLAFDLRVRPVRRLARPMEGWSREQERRRLGGLALQEPYGVGREVDAFLVAAMRQHPDGLPAEATFTRESVYLDWLEERLVGAAELDRDRTRLVDFERSTSDRGRGENRKGSQGPDATFHGVLTVTESAKFSHLLKTGVGRHTAFGFGMLLLRPARE